MRNSVGFLSEIEIFSLLKHDEIDKIISSFKSHDYDEGEILFKEGDEGNDLFIVKSGMIASTIELPGGGEREITTFEAGNFFGEMSIFENAPRSATCYCKEKSSLISLHEKDFYKIIEQYPDIATKILYRMLNITTQRLRNTGEFLSDIVHWGEAASKRAITDELTGAYNRRFLDDILGGQFEASKRSGKPLSLIMIDLDYFREINDNYGHEMGDRMILEVVGVYNRILRKKDFLARYGGDEFTVLMPDTDSEEARAIAENVRQEVEKLDLLNDCEGTVTRVTLSQGVASFPENTEDLKTLKEMADKSLYQAKDDGRNRVVCAC